MNFFHKIPLFIFKALCPCKIFGKENIPEGGAVIVSNHFHALDCGYILLVHSKNTSILAKKEIFQNKLVGKILLSYGGIPIDRDNPDMKSLMQAIKVLKKGNKLALFPEGTRNKTGTSDLQPLKGGAMVFAVKAKVPIVPMMMDRKLGLFRKVNIIVGKPFELKDFYDVKLDEEKIVELEKIVFEKMAEQQNILFDIIKAKKNRRENIKDESN